MKKLFLVAVLMFALAGHSKAVPSPNIFFNLSERILEEAHQFVFPVQKVTSKIQPKKSEVKAKSKTAVKSQQSLELLWNPTFKIRREGIWIIAE
ncbi:MAG TPA: hypothetical protein VF676_09945 [Flavobacterium sp.]|jgi:hypothetical protein